MKVGNECESLVIPAIGETWKFCLQRDIIEKNPGLDNGAVQQSQADPAQKQNGKSLHEVRIGRSKESKGNPERIIADSARLIRWVPELSCATAPSFHAMMSRFLLLALLATCVLAWLYGFIDMVEHAESGMKYYLPMAEAAPGLLTDQLRPYVFRWLGPWLAGVLPLSEPTAFYALAWVASLGLAVLFYAVCRADGVSDGAASLTVVLLAANPYLFGFNLYNAFQLNDVLAQVGIGLALWLLWRRQLVGMGLVLAITVLARESAVLMIPVAGVYLWEHGRLREEGARLARVLIPVGLLFVLPRLLLPETGGMQLGEQFAVESQKALQIETWARLLVNGWVPVVVLLVAWPKETLAWAWGHRHLVALFVLTLASAFFGTDQERLMQPAIWAVYLAVAHVVDRHWMHQAVAVGVLGVAAVLASLHHLSARFPLPDRQLTAVYALVAVGLAVGAAAWVRWRERSFELAR